MNTIEHNKDLVKRWPFLVSKIDHWTGKSIPEEELDYEIELFGDGIGLDSIDSLEIIIFIGIKYFPL